MVSRTASPACEVRVLDMKEAAVARRAKELGIRSVLAGVIDGQLAGCCSWNICSRATGFWLRFSTSSIP
ncbi:MAG: hypothetical protein K9K64_07655 [Desulfohalobiaceae bacterium]|nr:hypothetical protein [Desulfohalobiaceae bacterium]